jgi:DNA-binding transcriptional LysR family regulator
MPRVAKAASPESPRVKASSFRRARTGGQAENLASGRCRSGIVPAAAAGWAVRDHVRATVRLHERGSAKKGLRAMPRLHHAPHSHVAGEAAMLKTSLRYFDAIVRLGSIRAAAQHLRIAQSAVSRQVQSLEEEVGARLFERSRRGVILTQAGSLLRDYVQEASFQAERLRSELDALQNLRRGTVRLHVIESAVPHLVPAAIADFRADHPGIAFAVVVAGSSQVIGALKDGETDIGVSFGRTAEPELAVKGRVPEPLCAVMRADHPLATLPSVSVRQTLQWPVGIPLTGGGTCALLNAALAAGGLRLAPALETNSIDLLRRFALNGEGITFLTRLMVAGEPVDPRLVTIPVDDAPMVGSHVEVLTLRGRTLPLAAEAFVGYLVRRLKGAAKTAGAPPTRKGRRPAAEAGAPASL